MILEDATYDAFGYYPNDLKSQSNKPIIATCDECGKVRKTSNAAYRALCESCARKGNTNALGYKHTKESKAKMSAAKKGENHPMFNKHHSEATKALISKNHADFKGKKSCWFGKNGENTPNWQGGISFEPYCKKFNEEFKEYIRAKFGYQCFLCPTTQAENGKKLSVHHVNYNKNCGCDGDLTCQFVPLCKSCHSKTNGDRDYWQKIIMNKIHCLIIGWNV